MSEIPAVEKVDVALICPHCSEELHNKVVRLCSAEDLIIHKAVAGRPQDLRDIEGIVYRQGPMLDATTVRRWLGAFAEVLWRSRIFPNASRGRGGR